MVENSEEEEEAEAAEAEGEQETEESGRGLEVKAQVIHNYNTKPSRRPSSGGTVDNSQQCLLYRILIAIVQVSSTRLNQ